jgi:hypothetical protein
MVNAFPSDKAAVAPGDVGVGPDGPSVRRWAADVWRQGALQLRELMIDPGL